MSQKFQKIAYIHPAYFPAGIANQIQVMRMCEGLKQSGYEPTLIGRTSEVIQPGDLAAKTRLFRYYGIEDVFDVRLIHFPVTRHWLAPFRVLGALIFGLQSIRLVKSLNLDLIYTRDPYIAFLAILFNIPIVLEEHAPPQRKFHTWMQRCIYRSPKLCEIVFISYMLKTIYQELGFLALTHAPILVAHDAASQSQIYSCGRNICQMTILHTPPRVGYLGSLLPGRGIDLILEIARSLADFEFRIVGGTAEQIRDLVQSSSVNVVWRGFVAPGDLGREFMEMDVLLMPYQENTQTQGGVRSARWMSPLKMFEYMASGVALIASDLPVLREVLEHNRNCLLVGPEDVIAWIAAIRRLVVEPTLNFNLASVARDDVIQHYNWKIRAEEIMRIANQWGECYDHSN